MAKATTTIRQVLHHSHGEWLHANQSLFNRVAAFYFEVIQAHVKVLDLSNKEALTVLENLTHTTNENPHPVLPLSEIAEDIRLARRINGSQRSLCRIVQPSGQGLSAIVQMK